MVMSDSLQPCGLKPSRLLPPWNFLGKNTRVGCHALLHGIFQTQGLNLGLPRCGQILYQLSHKGSPGVLAWVASPFSRGSSRSRNWTRVSCIAGGFFTNWAIGEHHAEYIMWNARLDEAQAGIKIARRNINNLRYANDTTSLAEREEELKSLLMKVKKESEKAGLKLSIQKTKITASSPITSW